MAGNWKMYKTAQQTAAFFEQFKPLIENVATCEIVIFPVSIAIPAAVQAVEETSYASAARISFGQKRVLLQVKSPLKCCAPREPNGSWWATASGVTISTKRMPTF